MATREHHLSEFNSGPPPLGQPFQLLCEDHNGTYLLPFRCVWRDGWPVAHTGPQTASAARGAGCVELVAIGLARVRQLAHATSSGDP